MPQLLQLSLTKPRKKPASLKRAGIVAAAAALVAAALTGGGISAADTTTSNPASTLALNSRLFFVLDETISSHSQAGSTVRAHLRDPIVLNGVTVAAAGTPITIEITTSDAAQMGNINGSATIFIEPMTLADGEKLPLLTPSAYLDPHHSAGQESTQEVTDEVGDIFIPYHLLYHILRKGSDVTLRPGTLMSARTGATVSVDRGRIATTAPPSLVTGTNAPPSIFVPAPLDTPPGYRPPTPKPTRSVAPPASALPSPTP